jgi:cytochrome c-type biogenesis protein CcmH/NrfF
MMYFWVVPVILLAVLALWIFFREGTKRNPAGPSRLDEAQEQERWEGR